MEVRDEVSVSMGVLGNFVRQQRDFSTTADLEDYTNKFITQAPLTRERSRQRQESLTAQELSMLRGVRTASWRAQQMSPQFAAGVSLLLSATAQPVEQYFLDANKLVRDVHRSAAVYPLSFVRDISLFLLIGPMGAVAPDQMVLGHEVM